MKINYDFYTGNDSYCDGDTEKDVISYLKEYGEEGYAKIFEKDIRWPVYYHITPIRKNILKWYPFKENAEVIVGSYNNNNYMLIDGISEPILVKNYQI